MTTEAQYPVKDWQHEVANGDTRLGYAEWVSHRIEADAGAPTTKQVEPEQ